MSQEGHLLLHGLRVLSQGVAGLHVLLALSLMVFKLLSFWVKDYLRGVVEENPDRTIAQNVT